MLFNYCICKAFDSNGFKENDQANVKCYIKLDKGSWTELTNPPSDEGKGYYLFEYTDDERTAILNASEVYFKCYSLSSGVQVNAPLMITTGKRTTQYSDDDEAYQVGQVTVS